MTQQAIVETKAGPLTLNDLRAIVSKTQGWNGAAWVEITRLYESERLTVTLGGTD